MAAARCASVVKVAAARGSSWFSRKRARWFWKSRPAERCSRTGARVALRESVVEPLVVGVVEALLLQGPLEIPIDFSEEEEARDLGANSVRGPGPERGRGDPPRPLEDLRQDQHRHVAADAIALAGDPPQLAEQRVLQRGVAVVQLERVGPAIEVRIAPVGEDARALARLHAAVVPGR